MVMHKLIEIDTASVKWKQEFTMQDLNPELSVVENNAVVYTRNKCVWNEWSGT